jgi:hypothetical protein
MMQLILIVLTKNKETIYYYESFGYVANVLSTNISIVLMKLVYLQKMDQASSSWDFH